MNVLNEIGLTRLWKHIVDRLNNKVDKIEGKQLSTNDYTNEDKNKLNSLTIDGGGSNETLADMVIVSSTEPAVQEGKIWLKPVE